MINNHTNQSDFLEKMQRCQEYIHALEKERGKIEVFQRELPLCLELVTQAIEACKQQLPETTKDFNDSHVQSECSEPTSCDGPVLEEFIPMKRLSSNSDGEEQEQEQELKKSKNYVINGNDNYSKKSDWLRSVQLWNQTPDPPSKEDSPRKVSVKEVTRNVNGGAFHPFKKETSGGENCTTIAPAQVAVSRSVPPASASSTAETGGGGGNKKEDKESQSQRKSRRSWSPELHRRFLQALQQLGGSHVATPKQIREFMKVDGLTNDEVKSHLQKYRLHTRRPNTTIHPHSQTPQFVVVGGIWVPPEYASMASTTTTTSWEESGNVAAPIAVPSPPFQESKQTHHNKTSVPGDSEGRVQSHSTTTSSTDTTTASRAY